MRRIRSLKNAALRSCWRTKFLSSLNCRSLARRVGALICCFILVYFAAVNINNYVRQRIRASHLIVLRPEPALPDVDKYDIAARFPVEHLYGVYPNGGYLSVAKKIHFMYRSYYIDEKFAALLFSWRETYPDYQMYFWTDEEINWLVLRQYPVWQDLYHCDLANYMERSDVARAFVLDSMGGWYADLDTGSGRKADSIASQHALILPLEPYLHALNNFRMRRLVSNAIMYSVPQHPFWAFYLHQLKRSLVGQPTNRSTMMAAGVTGPVFLTNVTLMFQQALEGKGCPGSLCPHTPPPVQFLPAYDNNTAATRDQFRRLCTLDWIYQEFDIAEFYDECRRFAEHDYANYPLNVTESFAFHQFVHLNERKNDSALQFKKIDVRELKLSLVHGEELVNVITKL